MSKKRLMDILRDYIMNDLDSAEPGYVRDVLTDICLCSPSELHEIGLEWLFPDNCYDC